MIKKILIIVLVFYTTLSLYYCKKLEKEMMVTTGDALNIKQSSVDIKGSIVDIGTGGTLYGHYYGKSPNVNTSGTKIEKNSPANGDFSTTISGLEPNTKYYYKAYISDGNVYVYGEEKSFTTQQVNITITTSAISSISNSTAVSGGNIVADGSTNISARGVCWDTNPNPTISNSKTTDGTGTGSFVSNLSGLSPLTLYYVRAYATNSNGTIYGDEKSFTTLTSTKPSVTTVMPTSIKTTTATCGGKVTDEGGSPVTSRGVCWYTSMNPTIQDYKTTDGSGFGTFTSSLKNLVAGVTYYVRAYATNSYGTTYGDQYYFITYSLADADGNLYNTITIGTQTWMKENLKTTKYADNSYIYGVYENPDATNSVETYGRLYTWDAVMNGSSSSSLTPSGVQGVCPDGWHVPSIYEYMDLTDYLGGSTIAGGAMKETGITHWDYPNVGADNSSGFTALPTGKRNIDETFSVIGSTTIFWTTTEDGDGTWADAPVLYNDSIQADFGWMFKKTIAAPVRCIKD